MATHYSNMDVEDLREWLYHNDIKFKHLNRDFSDGVLFAQLVKKLYPKLVSLHNYSMCNSMESKMENWSTINSKILKKLGMKLDKNAMEKLSRGAASAIENLLLTLKRQHVRSITGSQTSASIYSTNTSPKGTPQL